LIADAVDELVEDLRRSERLGHRVIPSSRSSRGASERSGRGYYPE
jgi:hypothetical protein